MYVFIYLFILTGVVPERQSQGEEGQEPEL